MMVWFSSHRETGVMMPGIVSPLRGREVGDIDFHVIRENTEGEYSPLENACSAARTPGRSPSNRCLPGVVGNPNGRRSLRREKELQRPAAAGDDAVITVIARSD